MADLLGDASGVALLAVGGYGRREMCPGSDLDVVLLHDGRKDIKELADGIWYPIWDARISLDHSVRTAKEALAVAAEDLKVVLGLIDGRVVAGDADLGHMVVDRARSLWEKRAVGWMPDLDAQVRDRHARFGEVAFLLEPDLKEGKGGLRDVNVLRALAMAFNEIAVDQPIVDAYQKLLTVRVELQRRAGRATDVLLLQEQDAIAEGGGWHDADALMADVAAAARVISWASDDAWLRVRNRRARGRWSKRRMRPTAHGFMVRGGELTLAPDADAGSDPALPLKAIAASAEADAPLGRALLDRLVAESPAPAEPWPLAMRDALVAALGMGPAAVAGFEAIDHKGLFERVLPEWQAVRSRPQRNAYHRFTVDRHLLEAAAEAAAFTRDVSRPDLLLVGALLHDIGKGFPGDHTEAGMEIVDKIGRRMGFPPADVAVLVDLVRHHLLLPDVATRRDMDDPRTIEMVAAAVGDRTRLELLTALTEADSRATGPAAWSDWKAGLVRELSRRAAGLLAGDTGPVPPALPTEEHRRRMRERRLDVHLDGSTLTVIAPDRPGLFCRVAGALTLHGLDVRSAAAGSSEDGMAVEVFDIESAFGRPPDADRLAADVERAVSGRLSLQSRIDERARQYSTHSRPATVRPAEPRVLFDDDASETATVIEVRAPDGIGVLYRITRALADCDLDVRSAKVSTLGHEVVDSFYVTDSSGQRVTDAEHRAEIERAVLAELSRR